MNRLELFKPLMMLKDKMNPVLFDEIGIPYTNKWGKEKGFRPFVIFYDNKNDVYWYIKARDALNRDLKYNKNKYKTEEKGEILIKEADEGLFKKESYIDCSQIFQIDAELLESIVDKERILYKQTSILSKDDQDIILNKINECFNEKPPYLSIIEVYKMGDELKANSLYLCQEKYENLTDLSESQKWTSLMCDLLYKAKTDEYDDKWIEANDFKKKFQEKYFPSQSLKMKM